MLLTVIELRNKLGIGRDKAYALMRSSAFPSIKLGKQYYVTEEALKNWLHRMEYKELNL